MKKISPLGAYSFLLAAGEIDTLATSRPPRNVIRCGEELLRISRMNGSYQKLPENFRTDMRGIVGCEDDMETATKLGELGERLLALESLGEHERLELRSCCSLLSRFWPLEPEGLLVDDEH